MMLPLNACNGKHSKMKNFNNMTAFEKQSFNLLKIWCDAMIRDQVYDKSNSVIHGALYCHACDDIHGRCNDAIYPFMYMADATGEQKYLDAAIKLMEWSKNVDGPNGSWTNDINPKSWNGITVFGAIALGEALHHHGHLLSKEMKEKWDARLKASIEFVYERFDMHFSHINYRFTAIYALYFLGKYFDEEKYIKKSKEFATLIPQYLTEPNKLIFGEDKPDNDKSAKGFYPIDLGYNVEETLNGLVQYAVLVKDEELLRLLTESMNSHLEFMLPDGAWDNSWGTRQNKWTYWGSRTTDGCQPAFSLMADRNPAFGTAAVLSTELLERCTVNGLLAGGLHYKSHGVKPCIHHTFSHAKNLAFVLDNATEIKSVDKEKPLPRKMKNGVKHFSELDVWLAAKGPWRATVSSYDQVWKKPYSVAGTGGALNVLWHEKVGPVFTASMAEYLLVEPNNQQEQPGEDFCLTPRIERFVDNVWYTNIYDLKAKVDVFDKDNVIHFRVNTNLKNRDKKNVSSYSSLKLNYLIDAKAATIKASRITGEENGDTLVLPLISQTGEKVVQSSEKTLEIHKKGAVVKVVSNVPIKIKDMEKERIFNQVPGMEVLPLLLMFSKGSTEITCSIKVD
ncbi:hypothetical protein [Seonamhaeicola sp. S2-3]|uniref:hypothetical protein n=1 Tax=Seonamhaeicola sp. S2-3 TaxID=1936081 RepID=UPI0018DC0B45|nr:hypothetical protein [Seonamhaeicola sp. S2-3]